jgi:DNA polymerase
MIRVAWTNIAKCFPTENGIMRDPSKEEMLECSGSWLWEEILAYNPKLIVVFGSTATQFLLQNEIPITKIRGNINKINIFFITNTV